MDAAFAEWKKVRSEGFITRMWEFQALAAAFIHALSVSQTFSCPSCVLYGSELSSYSFTFCLEFFLFFLTFFLQFLMCNFFLFIFSLFLHGQNLFFQLEFLDEIDAPSNEEKQRGQDDSQGHHPGRCSGNKGFWKGSPKILFRILRKRSSRMRAPQHRSEEVS